MNFPSRPGNQNIFHSQEAVYMHASIVFQKGKKTLDISGGSIHISCGHHRLAFQVCRLLGTRSNLGRFLDAVDRSFSTASPAIFNSN